MAYAVKEIFYTLQGEGANAGRPAVFCRFAGCNLWSGREEDRANAVCRFCDTEFVGTDGTGGGRFATATDLAASIVAHWPADADNPRFVVLTGGEPLLQVDADLLDRLHDAGCTVAVETNGTIAAPDQLDWVCVSPKAGSDLIVHTGDELKLVYPQDGIDPQDFLKLPFSQFFLQPKDGDDRAANTELCVRYCLANPRWRLSLQTHKVLGIA
jgi:7-carboxy-7-deazaguanine synthase (Cx14CxxC type)